MARTPKQNTVDFTILIYCYLKIQIDFFEPVFIPAIRQKLFNRGQFGLTPVKNIYSIDFVSTLIKKEQVLFSIRS
jgi:hypothetical protein